MNRFGSIDFYSDLFETDNLDPSSDGVMQTTSSPAVESEEFVWLTVDDNTQVDLGSFDYFSSPELPELLWYYQRYAINDSQEYDYMDGGKFQFYIISFHFVINKLHNTMDSPVVIVGAFTNTIRTRT